MSEDHLGFRRRRSQVAQSVYIPKYYDPEIPERLGVISRRHDLLELGNLIDGGALRVTTGNEIGKMAYGTGTFPFVRTSDISNWEIKSDPKQGVSQAIFTQYGAK